MITIQSKRTGREETVTKETWEKMQDNDLARAWRVVGKQEPVLQKLKTPPAPVEIIEFIKTPKKK